MKALAFALLSLPALSQPPKNAAPLTHIPMMLHNLQYNCPYPQLKRHIIKLYIFDLFLQPIPQRLTELRILSLLPR